MIKLTSVMERYNEYKDSGVQWLGEIPSHWEVVPLKSLVSCNDDTWDENTSKDIILKYVEISDVSLTEGIKKITQVRFEDAPSRARRKTQIGDIIVSTVRTYLRAISPIAQEDITVSTGFAVLRPKNVNSKYILYFIASSGFVNDVISNSKGTSYPAINSSELIHLKSLMPPREEQDVIASYLDTVTSKIDTAIAQQQKMIDLLNERKQIIINNAVTKGLNPNVKMKDSGVDWIGEIPEGWEISRIKNVITLLTDYDANGSFSDIAKNCNINNGSPYAWMVRTTDLVNNRVGIVEGNNYCDKKTYDYLAKSSLESGDLLMTKRGNVGMVYVVPECSCPMTLAPNLYLLKTKASDVNNRYLMHYLSSAKPKSRLAILNKSTTLGALYKDDVKSLQIVLPSIEEQLLLAQHIDRELDKVDNVISSCNRQISLLQERKQIIINEVVTGKVKVS